MKYLEGAEVFLIYSTQPFKANSVATISPSSRRESNHFSHSGLFLKRTLSQMFARVRFMI